MLGFYSQASIVERRLSRRTRRAVTHLAALLGLAAPQHPQLAAAVGRQQLRRETLVPPAATATAAGASAADVHVLLSCYCCVCCCCSFCFFCCCWGGTAATASLFLLFRLLWLRLRRLRRCCCSAEVHRHQSSQHLYHPILQPRGDSQLLLCRQHQLRAVRHRDGACHAVVLHQARHGGTHDGRGARQAWWRGACGVRCKGGA